MRERNPKKTVRHKRKPRSKVAKGRLSAKGHAKPSADTEAAAATSAGTSLEADSPSAALAGADRRLDRSPRPVVESLAQLLSTIYEEGPRRAPALRRRDIVAMQTATKLNSEELRRLLDLAAVDRTLERTRRLMLLSMERLSGTGLAGPVREFIRTVLEEHLAFQTPALLSVLKGTPEPAVADAARALAGRNLESLPWPDRADALTKKQAEQCRINAMGCLMLWLRESEGTTPEHLLRCLQTSLWVPTQRRSRTDSQRFKTLITIRDPAAASVVCELLDDVLSEKRQQAETARSSAERATVRAQKAAEDLADCHGRFRTAQDEAETARTRLQNEQHERETESAHFRDDYQKLRGRLLQTLRSEVSLLDEGLRALRREPPKVHVMLDHAERVLDGLEREIERLRGED